ncbi:PPOX class F420-dependent oxidoreductase [Streptomyces yaizuensis]|uniref:PPOX class F420-dependent oxidoreductase n=1 Tax=Streptomyces yaizuensis TaxID=2989713 RepID=A0ABQ5P609_9ACTN|nr:PPOX class F420-dependent oxidoreductase [Streptomyces sp. YSPA8]GLF98005.1 PPOX class F420-dependent oxidoreductase [Streptomyces sp. YSPA8]
MTAHDLATARYISVTTYRRDGTGVATPVWFAEDGGRLYVWTNSDSWKVKRLRRDPRVTVAVCDLRGRIAPGTPVHRGTADILPDSGTAAVRKLLVRKYSWQFWLVDRPAALLRRGNRPHTAFAVTLEAAQDPGDGRG